MRIKKKDEIHATNGVIVNSLDGDSNKDAPSVHAVNEELEKIKKSAYFYISEDNESYTFGTYDEWVAEGMPAPLTEGE